MKPLPFKMYHWVRSDFTDAVYLMAIGETFFLPGTFETVLPAHYNWAMKKGLFFPVAIERSFER